MTSILKFGIVLLNWGGHFHGVFFKNICKADRCHQNLYNKLLLIIKLLKLHVSTVFAKGKQSSPLFQYYDCQMLHRINQE